MVLGDSGGAAPAPAGCRAGSGTAALAAGALAALLGARLGVTGLGLLVGYGWAAHFLAVAAHRPPGGAPRPPR